MVHNNKSICFFDPVHIHFQHQKKNQNCQQRFFYFFFKLDYKIFQTIHTIQIVKINLRTKTKTEFVLLFVWKALSEILIPFFFYFFHREKTQEEEKWQRFNKLRILLSEAFYNQQEFNL